MLPKRKLCHTETEARTTFCLLFQRRMIALATQVANRITMWITSSVQLIGHNRRHVTCAASEAHLFGGLHEAAARSTSRMVIESRAYRLCFRSARVGSRAQTAEQWPSKPAHSQRRPASCVLGWHQPRSSAQSHVVERAPDRTKVRFDVARSLAVAQLSERT
jgi:hypothetical protein